MGNIYIESILLVAFVKYILQQFYSHCTQNCIFWCFLESGNYCFETKNFSRSYIYVFFPPKHSRAGSLKISITREWLAVKIWATALWIASLMFYRLFAMYPFIKMTWFWPEKPSYIYTERSVTNSQGWRMEFFHF